jgi:hypothetical protein
LPNQPISVCLAVEQSATTFQEADFDHPHQIPRQTLAQEQAR